MTPRLRPALAVLVALSSACSQDGDGGEQPDDVSTDDVEIDASEGDADDVFDAWDPASHDADADADHADAPAPEICDDGVDNDEDGDVDCDDEDCADDQACPQPELCGDAMDNDGDGDIDCDDEDCCYTLACDSCGRRDPCDGLCTDDQMCIGGGCVDVTEPGDPPYEPADHIAYVAHVRIADGASDPTACCFDVDGDGDIDNGFGVTLAPFIERLGVDMQAELDALITDGTLAVLVEYREWPEGDGPARLSFWLGTNDLDDDGAPDDEYDDILAGHGTFRIENGSVTSYGAFIQFNAATVTGNVLYQPPTRFALTLPLGDLLPGIGTVDLELSNVEFEAQLDADDPRFTANFDVDGDEYGSGRLGGFIKLEQLFDLLNDVALSCTCAEGIDGGADVVEHGEGATGYEAWCAARSYDVSACDDVVCGEYLNRLCDEWLPQLMTIPVADIDSDGSSSNDAVSFGLFLTLVSAEIDREQPFTASP